MDRYVIRERRVEEYPPQGNQMIAISPNTGNNTMPPENMTYGYGGGGAEFPMHRVSSSGFMGVTHVNAPQFAPTNHVPAQDQGQVVSGIDPRYLASYADNNAAFIAGQQQQRQLHHQQQQREQSFAQINTSAFDDEYQKRNFVGTDRGKNMTFAPAPAKVSEGQQQPRQLHHQQQQREQSFAQINTSAFDDEYQKRNFVGTDRGKIVTFAPAPAKVSEASPLQRQQEISSSIVPEKYKSLQQQKDIQQRNTYAPPQLSATIVELPKNEFQHATKTRADKLKALHISGPRAFSGPVEKVLKWHKAMQDIGLLVLYEIVAKCVNVRPGESCAKNLVIRDDNGPAMQVVYYEVDFLLPELKLPCTVRVIGRMMPGTCRLQAFNVRLASGDDVATLPRRAAVAAHHVAKLCKEYGANVV